MTIGNIGSTTSFSQSGVGLDAEGQLALLVLENQQSRHDSASQDKLLARDRFVAESNEEVAAMHEEAHDILNGAIAQGVASVTAATIQVCDVADEPDCDPSGKTVPEKPYAPIAAGLLNATSQPLGKMLGDSPAANDRADAKHAATSAQQATWQLDDAKDVSDAATRHQDKALDWLASEDANRASTENGIIAGFA